VVCRRADSNGHGKTRFQEGRREKCLRRRRFLQSPLLHRQPFKKNKTLAIEHLPPDRAEESFKRRQREEFLASISIGSSTQRFEKFLKKTTYLRHPRQRPPTLDEIVRRSTQLFHLARAEDVGPSLGVVAVVFGFPDGWAGDFFGEERGWG
jgi:hypothetical protein